MARDPAARPHDEGVRFADCRPEPLRALFADAGLVDASVEPLVVPTVFADLDDYWTPFLGGTGPAPAYVASLREPEKDALKEALRGRLPVADDGAIHLTARAWAVQGRHV